MHYRALAPPTDYSHLLFLPYYYDPKHFIKINVFYNSIKKIKMVNLHQLVVTQK